MDGGQRERRFTWPDGFGPDGADIQDHLFDADGYFVGKGQRARRGLPPSKVVAVVTDARWRLVSNGTPGVLHRAIDEESGVTVCGIPALSLTFDDGQPAAGCPDCAAAGRIVS